MAIKGAGGVVVVRDWARQEVPLATVQPWSGVPGATPFSIEERAEFRAKERAMVSNGPAIKMRTLTRMEHPEDGRRLEPPGSDGKGADFEVHSELTAFQLVEKRLAERVSPEAPTEEEAAAAGETEDLEKPWTLAMLPAAYLEKYGDDAKHSAHAKAVLDREKAKT
jgi:hypothetical protein